ncbi:MAG: sigma-70 family RNA polymerase sigma factor [Actinobacteria bacterium]|nr:sigma-70 family RNA polymerase sigma factor [Actinomycetota bacterium]
MAIRARADNLSLDYPEPGAVAPRVEFAEVWAHREVLRQACVRLTGDRARAEDLVQDTFVSALRSRDRLERRASLGPWLATVARRRSIDEIRGRQRVAVVATPPESYTSYGNDPAEHVLNQELGAQLRAAVDTLTNRERQLLLRQATYGMSLAELAAEERTSVASVRSVLARARHKLRMALERNGALGVLPLPRVLLSAREKVARWMVQFESSLPALTGAGVHVGNVVVAVVAAIVTMFGGMAAPVGGDSIALVGYGGSPTTVGDAPGRAGGERRAGGGQPGATDVRHADREATAAAPTTSTMPGFGAVPLPSLPDDGNHTTADASFDDISSSEDGRYVFAAGRNKSGFATIFRSSDFGATWTRVQANGVLTTGRVLVPPTYPAQPTLFVVNTHALWRSDNDGVDFFAVAPANGGAAFSPDYASGDDRVFVAGSPVLEYSVASRLTNVLTSTVGKPSFSDVVVASTFSSDEALILGGTVTDLTGTRFAAVYRCTPSSCSPPVKLPDRWQVPDLRRLTDGRIAALTQYGVYFSHDDGMSFSAMRSPVPDGVHQAVSDGPSGDLVLGVSRQNATTGVYISGDDGATWTAVGFGGPVEGGTSDVLVLPTTGAIVAAPMRSRGVTCSTDSGATWKPHC